MFKWLKREKRLEELEENWSKLEKRVRDMELEWDSVYEKFRLLNMRISKRVQQLDRAPETETTQREEGDETNPSGNGASLSERHKKLQEQILARRNRSGLLHG